jgi:hypothetical protein
MFHDYVVHGRTEAVNAAGNGTKAAAGLYRTVLPAAAHGPVRPARRHQRSGALPISADIFSLRIAEADLFYARQKASTTGHVPHPAPACRMLWNKQFADFNVAWLNGDPRAAAARKPQARPQL